MTGQWIILPSIMVGVAAYLLMAPAKPKTPQHHGNATPQKTVLEQHPTLNSSHAALCLELLSVVLKTGASLNHAFIILAEQSDVYRPLFSVARSLERGLNWKESWDQQQLPAGWDVLARELKFAYQTAVPTAEMLKAAADHIRREESQRITERSREISSKLVLPTGLLALPAFICWGVLPAVLALFQQSEIF